MRRPVLLPHLIVAALMVAAFLATQMRLDGDSRPRGDLEDLAALAARDDLNVLFVLVDTLRADHLGAYGYARPTSPRIDALAETGIRFEDHLAQSSWTKTSMSSIWTSLYPQHVGVLRSTDVISPEADLPAETLRRAGFRTVGLWRNGWVAPNFGFGQGFESYVTPRPGRPPEGFRRENPGFRLVGNDFDIVTSFDELLRTSGDGRWFVYAHMMDVHQYATDEVSALFGPTYLDAYDNAIHFTDRAVDALLDLLEARDLRDRTLVVLASDHGEAFGEHGFEGHARDLHAEVTRTPWILSLPFRLDPGIVIDAPSENVDVWPTVFDLLGIELDAPIDGRSLAPEIRTALARAGGAPEDAGPRAPHPPRTRIAHLDRHWARAEVAPLHAVALTTDRHRLFYYPGRTDLYDRERDPAERANLAERDPETAAALRQTVEDYLASEPVWSGGVPQVELDDMQLGQLRALGYVVEGGR
ncbi:MAG: sulfatase [Myxococcales bacterium]|nr:sulfatase [Myxococcales bacterium]